MSDDVDPPTPEQICCMHGCDSPRAVASLSYCLDCYTEERIEAEADEALDGLDEATRQYHIHCDWLDALRALRRLKGGE